MAENYVNDPANDETLPEKPEFVKVLFLELEQILKIMELAKSFYEREMKISIGFREYTKAESLKGKIADLKESIDYISIILEDK